jgi:DNA-binding response OmpR family regulator
MNDMAFNMSNINNIEIEYFSLSRGNNMALIAIIDDDPDILDASSLVLNAKGYEVITADNPDDGYKIVKEQKPDLIILDVMMNEPDDGFYLAQKFRKEKFDIPIIMYTSVSKALGLEFAAGEMIPVDEFIEKPISPDTLVDKVEKLLQLHFKE